MTTASVWAVVLAAGLSSRMKGDNKLLQKLDDVPVLARTLAEVTGANFAGVVVVTGHMRDKTEKIADGFAVQKVHNPDFAEGLSTSLNVGISALPATASAAAIILADMPLVTTDVYNRLIAAAKSQSDIIVPAHQGKRGNPIIWGRNCFTALTAITGDQGARHLLKTYEKHIRNVVVAEPSVHIDFDTPQSFATQNKER